MFCKLSPEYALRSWKNTDTVLLNLNTRQLARLDLLSFLTLSRCDGATKCDPADKMLQGFLEKRIAVPCSHGDKIDKRQEFLAYSNEYFPIVQWAITNRCNYLCKHCFMASSAQSDTAEPTHAQCMDIIGQLAECGIMNAYITGGEPLLRGDFLNIVDTLTKRGINIDIISTNGLLVNEALLAKIESRDLRPAFTVSFDGEGCHDWLRGYAGAEEASIRAIKLIAARGFPVIMEMAVHKGNAGAVEKTAELAHSLGVNVFKTIRVADSPRWKEMGKDHNLTIEEYYGTSLEVLKAHTRRKWRMDMKLIGFAYYYHASGRCDILPMKGLESDTDDTVLCRKARSILFISGDGRLLPCNPFNGITSGKEDWGNVFKTPLRDLLTDSAYLGRVNARVQDLKESNEKCRECRWFKYCLGGCRACAYADSRDYLAADPTKCAFFMGGYADRIRDIVGSSNCTEDFGPVNLPVEGCIAS